MVPGKLPTRFARFLSNVVINSKWVELQFRGVDVDYQSTMKTAVSEQGIFGGSSIYVIKS